MTAASGVGAPASAPAPKSPLGLRLPPFRNLCLCSHRKPFGRQACLSACRLRTLSGASFRFKECESFFYQPVADAPVLATHPQLRIDRAGSCSWDSRTRRCIMLAPHKEPCLTANLFSAAGKGPRFEPVDGDGSPV